MNHNRRPAINLDVTKFEVSLIRANIALILLVIVYSIVNWNGIPDFIQQTSKSGRIYFMYKRDYLSFHAGAMLFIMLMQFFSTCTIRPHDVIKFEVSSDLLKARKQYRIEDSCCFCFFVICQLFFSMTAIVTIESQRGHIPIDLQKNLLFIPLLLIIVTWLVHAMRWRRLSD